MGFKPILARTNSMGFNLFLARTSDVGYRHFMAFTRNSVLGFIFNLARTLVLDFKSHLATRIHPLGFKLMMAYRTGNMGLTLLVARKFLLGSKFNLAFTRIQILGSKRFMARILILGFNTKLATRI